MDMTQEDLNKVIGAHEKWLVNIGDGKLADFSGMDLRGMDFSHKNLRWAIFEKATLDGANFFGSDLSKADFTDASMVGVGLEETILKCTTFTRANLAVSRLQSAKMGNTVFFKAVMFYTYLSTINFNGADMGGANLEWAVLDNADLSNTNLIEANIANASLFRTNLRKANLCKAQLMSAKLSEANLSFADMRGANLECAYLKNTVLIGADLSDVAGLLNPIDYMADNFEKTKDGYIVYKTFGESYALPEHWEIKNGSVISEVSNNNRSDNCGSGINVATLKWLRNNYNGQIWKCLIKWEWLCGVTVPYNTDGKIRCERLQILEPVDKEGVAI